MFVSLQGEMQLCLREVMPAYRSIPDVAADHRRLLTALQTGDHETGVAAVREHLDVALDDVISLDTLASPTERDGRVEH